MCYAEILSLQGGLFGPEDRGTRRPGRGKDIEYETYPMLAATPPPPPTHLTDESVLPCMDGRLAEATASI
eukprot:gene9650-biopygen2857